MYTLVTAIDKN